tara:strand:+ start:1284 stop:1601 length:318 start_codon:yes stop_codon:yes gene_type:complete
MVKKHMRADDGMYHIKGRKYELLVGSRAQVWHRTAYKTSGDLKHEDFLMNKRGRVVSKKKFNIAKKEKRLEKAGYFTKKGKFGYVKRSVSKSRSHKATKKHRKKH